MNRPDRPYLGTHRDAPVTRRGHALKLGAASEVVSILVSQRGRRQLPGAVSSHVTRFRAQLKGLTREEKIRDFYWSVNGL